VDAASCRVAAAGSRCHFFAEFRQNISKQALKHEFSEVWPSRWEKMEIMGEKNNGILEKTSPNSPFIIHHSSFITHHFLCLHFS